MKRVTITGSNGVIGSVLRKGLHDYKIIPLDLPDVDVRDYNKLLQTLPYQDTIVHLAWNKSVENYRSGRIDPDNLLMVSNVYRAAVEAGVPRVIMASSVHVDTFDNWKGHGLLTPDKVPVPNSPYGASKIFMESLGKYYSSHGLEVVCIRLGGVNSEDRPDSGENGYHVWLSHRDCVELVKACIDALYVPNNFIVMYAVSESYLRIHDYTNPFGWIPKDNADNRSQV